MNKPPISDEEKALIEKLHELESTYWQTIFKLRDTSSDHVAIVKNLAWKSPSTWDFIALLSIENRKKLFGYMLDTATDINHPCREQAFKEIHRLPGEWVLENIEKEMQSFIDTYQDEAYICLLEILQKLDFDRAVEWARKANSHENADIQDVGRDWLKDNNLPEDES